MAFADPATGRVIRDSGRGTEPGKVTLAEACKVGDVLGLSSGGEWKRALATVGSVIQGRVIALAGGASGDMIPVSANPIVEGYTGATPGNTIYVAEGTDNGKVTPTIPITSGDATTAIGLVLSPTSILFYLNSRADSVAA